MRSVRRVLLVEPYGIGDLLFVTPVLRALRLSPTVEKVDLLLGSRTEEVVRHNPHVDEIFVVDKDRFHRQQHFATCKDVWNLGQELRRRRYDLLLDYSLRGEYAFLSRMFLGIPRRVGFDYKRRGWFHNRRVPLPEGFSARHVVDYYCDLAERNGIPVEDRYLEFYLRDEAREAIEQWLEEKIGKRDPRFLVVSPGGGESWGKDASLKRWPVNFFSVLSKQIMDRISLDFVVLLGSLEERKMGEAFCKEVHIPCFNLMGETTLTQSAAWIEKAVLFLGNDGGLVHVAHAFRVPLVAFYGPVDPDIYGPYPPSSEAVAVFKKGLECRPCYRQFRYQAHCVEKQCLQALKPTEVLNLLETQNYFGRFQLLDKR